MEPKLDGVPLRLGSTDYVLSPLNLDALEKNWDQILSLNDPGTTLIQRLRVVVDILHASLARNYPRRWGLWGGVSKKQLRRKLDIPSLLALHASLMNASGLMRQAPGEPEAGSVPIGAKSGPE
jgi:hypothetical protein